MNELALFAGGGGGSLASKWLLGWRTVCYVENGAYPVEVLKARIRDGLLDDAPIWGDARTFDGRPWRGCVDIVTAGFPCQPFSQAGKRLGEDDDRNLWPATARIIREVRPRYVLLENVPALRCSVCRDGEKVPAYFGRVLGDLAESGYDARWDCIPAAAVGANHQRDRLWVVAYSTEPRLEGASREGMPRAQREDVKFARCREDVADANGGGFKEHTQFDGQAQEGAADGDPQGRYAGGRGDEVADADGAGSLWQRTDRSGAQQSIVESRRYWRGWWEVEPDVGRVADGVAQRVERLAAIGNGQVPAVVAVVWGLLSGD